MGLLLGIGSRVLELACIPSLTAQLVNAADGYHLWSERYDREMKDVFAIQEEIAQAIAQRLKITFPWGSLAWVRELRPRQKRLAVPRKLRARNRWR